MKIEDIEEYTKGQYYSDVEEEQLCEEYEDYTEEDIKEMIKDKVDSLKRFFKEHNIEVEE